MGELERNVSKRVRRVNIQRRLVLAMFRMTVPSSLAFAPDEVLLRKIDPDSINKGSPTRRMWQALKRLESKGLVRIELKRGARAVALTAGGRKFAERMHVAEKLMIKKPRRWDGKWRIVIFDIWERRRGVRDQLRKMLVRAGFKRLQDSVWVYPYDCEELLAFLRADLRLGNGILYLIAEGIENDTRLRVHFGL